MVRFLRIAVFLVVGAVLVPGLSQAKSKHSKKGGFSGISIGSPGKKSGGGDHRGWGFLPPWAQDWLNAATQYVHGGGGGGVSSKPPATAPVFDDRDDKDKPAPTPPPPANSNDDNDERDDDDERDNDVVTTETADSTDMTLAGSTLGDAVGDDDGANAAHTPPPAPPPGGALTQRELDNLRRYGYRVQPQVLTNDASGTKGIPGALPKFDRPRRDLPALQLASARGALGYDVTNAISAGQPPAPAHAKPDTPPGMPVAPDPKGDPIGTAPWEADKELGLALAMITAEDLGSALAAVERAISINPNSTDAYAMKAEVLNRLGRYGEAETAARWAAKLDPKNAKAFNNLGWAQLNNGKLNDAVASFTEAIKLNPSDPRAFIGRAMAYEALGNEKLKMADLETAASLDSRYNDHLEYVKNGGKLFAPNSKDSYRLLDPLEEGAGQRGKGSPFGRGLFGVLAVLGCGVGISLWRKKTAVVKPVGASVALPQANSGSLLGGKYELTRVIGRGGMGQIWEGRDTSLNRTVAVKEMKMTGQTDAQARESYIKEAQTLAQVHHPNIVDIIEIIENPTGIFLIFELLRGKTLEQIILENKRLPLSDAKKYMGEVGKALEFAHKNGIIHRDLKPANVMVTDGREYVKVMDFGISRQEGATAPVFSSGMPIEAAGRQSSRTQTAAGTPLYMAPEAYEGVYSPGVDVYAMGIMLYELVSGELPFSDMTAREKVFASAVAGLPAELDALVRDSVDLDPARRPANVAEFVRRMDAIPETNVQV